MMERTLLFMVYYQASRWVVGERGDICTPGSLFFYAISFMKINISVTTLMIRVLYGAALYLNSRPYVTSWCVGWLINLRRFVERVNVCLTLIRGEIEMVYSAWDSVLDGGRDQTWPWGGTPAKSVQKGSPVGIVSLLLVHLYPVQSVKEAKEVRSLAIQMARWWW